MHGPFAEARRQHRRRVLRKDGRLVAWWYERAARPGPETPRHPRLFEDVASAMSAAGFGAIAPLALEFGLEPAPATIGASATA